MLKVVLEEDGSEVDDDYFSFIPQNVVLQLLTVAERWESPEGINLVNTREPIIKNSHVYVCLCVCLSVRLYNGIVWCNGIVRDLQY